MIYDNTWQSLDKRPVPAWFGEAKFGIFIHWGVYSVPAFAPKRNEVGNAGGAYSEWYGWAVRTGKEPQSSYHKKNYKDAPYEDFAEGMTGELFDAEKWIKLFKDAGAKYLVAVSKHHDGFTLFDGSYSKNWNSIERGPKRDVIGELFAACDKLGFIKGAYYSLLEWPHPVFTGADNTAQSAESYATSKMIPEMKEFVERYNPEILFTDGEWDYDSDVWHSRDFLCWLFNESSVKDKIVVNDRWGRECRGVHGGYKTCEYGEVNSPAIDEKDAQKNLETACWEEVRSVGASFGFSRCENVSDYLGEKELIKLLVTTVSKGGNLCLNVGPCADGTISPIIEERLRAVGKWLDVNGEAIYGTKKSRVASQNGYYTTEKADSVFVTVFDYKFGKLKINTGDFVPKAVSLLGYPGNAEFSCSGGITEITVPVLSVSEMPCDNAWTFRLTK